MLRIKNYCLSEALHVLLEFMGFLWFALISAGQLDIVNDKKMVN